MGGRRAVGILCQVWKEKHRRQRTKDKDEVLMKLKTAICVGLLLVVGCSSRAKRLYSVTDSNGTVYRNLEVLGIGWGCARFRDQNGLDYRFEGQYTMVEQATPTN